MKKSLIALAVMAAAGAASAQSSVTLFGIVDATISHQNVHAGGHNTFLSNSGYNSSRLGFRGTEDLGGGMAASFWLEAGVNNDNGSGGTTTVNNTTTTTGGGGLTFNRRSTVSLSGNWGEVRLGRDYVPTFFNTTVFDPFGTNGVGTNIIHKAKNSTTAAPGAVVGGVAVAANDPLATRASNMIGYFLPANLGGIYGQVNYAFDEVGNCNAAGVCRRGGGKQGRYIGTRLGYGSGPFNVAVAYSSSKGTDFGGTAAAPDVKDVNIGGQWDFGIARIMGEFDRTRFETVGGDVTLKGWMIGTLVPVGAGEIRASYGRAKLDNVANEPRTDQLAIGYVHNLSKRTALYATVARLKNHDGAALQIGATLPQSVGAPIVTNGASTGYDLGIRHSF